MERGATNRARFISLKFETISMHESKSIKPHYSSGQHYEPNLLLIG